MHYLYVTLASFFIALSAHAYFEPTQTGDKPREMNGIFFEEHKDFTKTWRLVTVRFRQDSGEQRMVYANEKAYEGLKKLKPDFADGAMFAKVAFITEDDPAFPSSKTPAGAKRYQFMLKDKKKYSKTDGWGYALFDDQGNLFAEDMKAKTDSCVACHRIVPDRDYVFSRQMLLHHDELAGPAATAGTKIVTFETVKVATAPVDLKKYTKLFDYLNTMTGPIQKSAFSGTLDEVVPLLSSKSKLTNTPSALIIDDKNFSLVIPMPKSKKCLSQNSNLTAVRVLLHYNAKLVRDAETCL
ncbi:MAG: cytochrome P460 family protein [Bdellovibrionota bacterium]